MASYIQMLGQTMAAVKGSPGGSSGRLRRSAPGGQTMAAPASIVISKILIPETEVPRPRGPSTPGQKNASNVSRRRRPVPPTAFSWP